MEIRTDVSGEVPPAKGEAKSMLSPPTLSVAECTTSAAASTAMSDRELLAGDVRVDVALSAPRGQEIHYRRLEGAEVGYIVFIRPVAE